jgi:hypothetical protein
LPEQIASTWASRDHRHGVEGKGVDGLAGWEAGFEEMPLDAPAITLGDLVFGEGGEQARSRPGFLVGARGELGARPA